ncbi:hypothetical protein HK405_004149, partial [Cladochytrium tenue]
MPRPVPLTFSLPWWLLVGDVDAADDAVANAKDTRRGGISSRFVQARELARTLSRKVALSRTLHCPTPADLTYLTCCVRFSPSATSVGKEIQRTLSGGFDAASRLPPAITQASPRLGPVAAADRAMQARYRELADVGTRKRRLWQRLYGGLISRRCATATAVDVPVGSRLADNHREAASTSGGGIGGVGSVWLGLGAAQFCPACIDQRSEKLEGLVRELDELNTTLVARLRDEQHGRAD